jgi:hypothetical protein
MSDDAPQKSQLLIYQAESGAIKIDVRFENETVWLTQAQIAELFQTTIPNVSRHLRNVFAEGELKADSVVKGFLTTAADGKNYSLYRHAKISGGPELPLRSTHKESLSVRRSTPTALCLPAQGCELRATLGRRDPVRPTPKGLWPKISAA